MNLTYYDKSLWIPASWEAQVDTPVDTACTVEIDQRTGGGRKE